MLLKKMAENAKIAQDALDKAMAKTARTFAKQKATANERNTKTIARSKATRAIMRKNKREAAHALHEAVHNQQRALASLAATTNAKIAKTNAHIAANAAQIKINAKKAQDALAKANDRFNNKMFNMKKEAKNARSKLANQAKDMDKKLRAMISGKVKGIAMKTASQFADVRGKMAADRAHADAQLKQATTKIAASLNAAKVLQNKRYAQTVANIAAAKKEASDLVSKAQQTFKVNLMHLQAEVKTQVGKLNHGVTQLQGTITKNKMEQAKVNRKVRAEMKRMIELGNKRELTLANKDKALRALMIKNKAANNKSMIRMANKFNNAMSKIKDQMKKDRARASRMLKKTTDQLYKTLKDNEVAQGKVNDKLAKATARAKLDAEDALRNAKRSFVKRLSKLHATVVKNDKKHDGKVKALLGIVNANAAKDAEGRKALKMVQKANKNELKSAVRSAIQAGEARALQIEKNAKDMKKKTVQELNMKVTTKIAKLRKSIHGSIEDLKLDSAEARAAMKREILYAVRESAEESKKELAAVVKWSNQEFNSLDKQLEKADKKNAAARKALQATVDKDKKIAQRALKDAVTNQNRALFALKEVTKKEIKKTNTDVAAYGEAVAKQAKDVDAQMK